MLKESTMEDIFKKKEKKKVAVIFISGSLYYFIKGYISCICRIKIY